jgi:hypothetical protein
VTRDDWSGLLEAPRWWHIEGGLLVYGTLVSWRKKRGRTRLHVHIPDGGLTLTIRAEGVNKLTIGGPDGE